MSKPEALEDTEDKPSVVYMLLVDGGNWLEIESCCGETVFVVFEIVPASGLDTVGLV